MGSNNQDSCGSDCKWIPAEVETNALLQMELKINLTWSKLNYVKLIKNKNSSQNREYSACQGVLEVKDLIHDYWVTILFKHYIWTKLYCKKIIWIYYMWQSVHFKIFLLHMIINNSKKIVWMNSWSSHLVLKILIH